MIVIADAAKEVVQLGAFPLPVEVIPFGWQTTKALVEETLVPMDVLGRDDAAVNADRPLVTDESNYILDLHLNRIGNARQLALVLNQIPRRGRERAFHRHLRHRGDRPRRRPRQRARHQHRPGRGRPGGICASDNIFADLE